MTGPRGPYAKTAARREAIVRAARESFVERGVEGASLRDIAARAGITHAGLLHHFASKDELVVEVLRQRDDDETEQGRTVDGGGSGAVRPFLVSLLEQHQDAPEIMRLWGELTAAASRPGHPGRAYFMERYEQARTYFADYLRQEAAAGRLRDGVDPEQAAALVTAVMDGLQTQWLLHPSLPIGELLDVFLGLLVSDTRDRTGGAALVPDGADGVPWEGDG